MRPDKKTQPWEGGGGKRNHRYKPGSILALVGQADAFSVDTEAALAAAGFHSVVFREGRSFLSSIQQSTYEAVLLDWNIPGLSGLNIIEELRGPIASTIPILVTTARDDDRHVIEALDAGADDFIVNPVSTQVLAAHLRARLRRSNGNDVNSPNEEYGPYSFDMRRLQVARNGVWIDLAAREFWLARTLFQNLGRPVARAFLTQKVWGHANGVASRTLDAHICRLRRKLDLLPAFGFRIAMVYGYGYRLETVSHDRPSGDLRPNLIESEASATVGQRGIGSPFSD